MPNYKAQVDQRTYAVSSGQLSGHHLKATLTNETYDLEAAAGDQEATWMVRTGEATIPARARLVSNDKVLVWVGGLPFHVRVHHAAASTYSAAQPLEVTTGEIRAIMPGRITSILVSEGDSIDLGTPILVLEAMKMQNEITSPSVGRVKSIKVREGETVKKDSVLVQIEARGGDSQ